MNGLEIIDLYDKYDDKKINSFCDNIDSNLRVVTNSDSVDCNFEWLEIMEDTIQYLDNILRNPNRFIVNEEDIVKIELARRVTVESIKHLSKNTNLIQDYNKETGDVRPSKILNINKEESFDTYENRFIYSLIKNMKFYIDRKKRNLITESSSKDDTKMEYNAKSSIGRENVDISIDLLRNIENGRNIGSVPTLLNLCNFLKISPNFLFSELLTFKEDTLDTYLTSSIKSISKEDKELLKNIIIHIDKNY